MGALSRPPDITDLTIWGPDRMNVVAATSSSPLEARGQSAAGTDSGQRDNLDLSLDPADHLSGEGGRINSAGDIGVRQV